MATWYISDSQSLPYLHEFHAFPDSQKPINDYPSSAWKIHEDPNDNPRYKVPFRSAPPELKSFDDAPSAVWRIGKRDDIPYKLSFRKMYNYLYEVPEPVYQPSYICVYDMHNPQNGFDDNGLCILCPSLCEITEELNGTYELVLEHPFDSEGRWRYLQELNIIKANGQLFRIYAKQTTMSADGTRLRTVNARHIFYDLNDKLLVDVRPENKDGIHFIQWIMDRIYDDDPEHFYPVYTYSWYSDIEKTGTSYFIGASVTGALLGEDNSFVNRLGGEIHRDNFYFSINQNKEGSEQEAFEIKYGVDMIEVEESIDYSDLITALIAKDNFGHVWEVSYKDTPRLHHNVSRLVEFSYERDDEAGFRSDAEDYFRMYCNPNINYRVVFANLKGNELYEDFIGLQDCNVGDTGTIYCEELGIKTLQKVIRKTTDVLTNSTVEIELGNLASDLTRRDKYSGTIVTQNSADKAAAAAAEAARKAMFGAIKNWGDASAYKWQDLRVGTWAEAYKNKIEIEEEKE